MAGANPHATVVKTVTISENNKAEELNVIAASGGMVPEGIRATITCNPKMAKMQPRAQLTAANAKLSTNNCLMICVRLAPTADRMPTSLSRVVAPAELKTRWHDAHKGHGSTVEPVGVAKHVGGAIEEFGPKAVTDDENGRCPRPVIVGTQATAE